MRGGGAAVGVLLCFPGADFRARGCSSMAEHLLPKQIARVRFPSAPPQGLSPGRRHLAARAGVPLVCPRCPACQPRRCHGLRRPVLAALRGGGGVLRPAGHAGVRGSAGRSHLHVSERAMGRWWLGRVRRDRARVGPGRPRAVTHLRRNAMRSAPDRFAAITVTHSARADCASYEQVARAASPTLESGGDRRTAPRVGGAFRLIPTIALRSARAAVRLRGVAARSEPSGTGRRPTLRSTRRLQGLPPHAILEPAKSSARPERSNGTEASAPHSAMREREL